MKFRSFDSFRVFEKVAQLESITLAAEALNLSKSANPGSVINNTRAVDVMIQAVSAPLITSAKAVIGNKANRVNFFIELS